MIIMTNLTINKLLDVIYIPPEPQTLPQINDPVTIGSGSSLIQVAAAVVMAVFLAASLISAIIYISKHSKPKQEA